MGEDGGSDDDVTLVGGGNKNARASPFRALERPRPFSPRTR
jgi:hypothetical protein